MRTRFLKNQRGAALIEAAVTLPIILFISVAIFEFGRAYQTWQVLTNAAREGARVAIISGTTEAQIKEAVREYGKVGQIAISDDNILIDQTVAVGATSGSKITVAYPFQFIVLNPVAKLVVSNSETGKPLTMSAVAIMRNESGS
jgi:Flp pilus assembly protein TadG